ncbi:unnamed protein product [Rhizophagus irregularis]|uniref:Uncharacterized protein n=1 Tax=Rhizophagus irregularis TaxID=588596 RepID=A0A915ZFU3_9GLOM|nr:unnamed protein product [Rhizophagus irregularis]
MKMKKDSPVETDQNGNYMQITRYYCNWGIIRGFFWPADEMHYYDLYMVGRIMEAGYAHSESTVLLCNTWDLVVSEGSGDVSLGHRQLGANG